MPNCLQMKVRTDEASGLIGALGHQHCTVSADRRHGFDDPVAIAGHQYRLTRNMRVEELTRLLEPHRPSILWR